VQKRESFKLDKLFYLLFCSFFVSRPLRASFPFLARTSGEKYSNFFHTLFIQIETNTARERRKTFFSSLQKE
jgi:hypothetical protein